MSKSQTVLCGAMSYKALSAPWLRRARWGAALYHEMPCRSWMHHPRGCSCCRAPAQRQSSFLRGQQSLLLGAAPACCTLVLFGLAVPHRKAGPLDFAAYTASSPLNVSPQRILVLYFQALPAYCSPCTGGPWCNASLTPQTIHSLRAPGSHPALPAPFSSSIFDSSSLALPCHCALVAPHPGRAGALCAIARDLFTNVASSLAAPTWCAPFFSRLCSCQALLARFLCRLAAPPFNGCALCLARFGLFACAGLLAFEAPCRASRRT